MLPTDIDDCFLTMAVMAVTSSGSEVPMATIVTAMMRSDTPSIWARTVPLSTSRFEPTTRHAAPRTNSARFFRSALRLLSTTAAPSVCSSTESFFALRIFSMMNATNSASTIRLSGRLSTPSRHKSQSTSVLTTIRTPFTANWLIRMATGRKMSEMAMIMPVLAVTEPMALPIAISVLPSAAAIVETMISGSVVAMDTTVAPIRNCGRPEASAIHVAASTNQSPPLTINASPSRNSKIVMMSDDDIKIPPCISQKDEKKTFCT